MRKLIWLLCLFVWSGCHHDGDGLRTEGVMSLAGALGECAAGLGDWTALGSVDVVDVQCGILLILATLEDLESPDLPECLEVPLAKTDVDCDSVTNVTDLLVVVGLSLGEELSPTLDGDGNGCPEACEVLCASGVGDPCSGQGACGNDGSCVCDFGFTGGDCTEGVPVPEFGVDGSAAPVLIGNSGDGLNIPRDLAFNPGSDGELWVVNRADDSTVTYFNAATPQQSSEWRSDVLAHHYMEEVSSIAFGVAGRFATCQESLNTYNGNNSPNFFMGPTLWDSDLDVYAAVNQDYQGSGDLLGSHLDMLHESPLCMGIAHDVGNAYWAFSGFHDMLMRFDFNEDHGPGGNNHVDGIVARYPEVTLTRVSDVPGHMAVDPDTGWLYIADTGGKRIVAVDTASGVVTGPVPLSEWVEPLEKYSVMEGVIHVTLTESGLQAPCGIALSGGRLFVSDHDTGEIIAFGLDGAEIDRYDTGATGLMGLAIGPEGRIWYVDADANELWLLQP